jgi:antitoxin MazE
MIYVRSMYIMEFRMKVSKWGNSLAVRIPTDVVDSLNLKEGDEIELRPVEGLQFDVIRQASPEERLRRLRELMRGTLPADFKFNRDEANER